jgi:hypothetical protein
VGLRARRVELAGRPFGDTRMLDVLPHRRALLARCLNL